MAEPRWLTVAVVDAIHGEALAAFGGLAGLRDEGLLESALDRPRNLLHYGSKPTLFALAAALCAWIVRNHPFLDGNERTGLLAAVVFLYLNGVDIQPDEADEVATMIALAQGQLDEAGLAEWLEANAHPVEGR